MFDKDFKVFMGECCEVIRNYEGDYEVRQDGEKSLW